MTTKSNIVSLESISPPRYEGKVDVHMLENIVSGLLVPSVELSRRLALELLKLGYGKEEMR